VAALDVQTHPVEGLLGGAWRRRHHLSLADALYVELARLDTVVVTTDHRLSRATPLAVAPPA
jgi:predicted nucleic acid-binding protein